MKHASKYKDWKDIYNWDTCKTNRKAYGKFLCSFLTNTDDSLVVNLNGSWGTGKTELLRRLYIELAERQHPVVYIDAWESDFSDDPLAVVCSEFLTQLGNIFQDNENESKREQFAKAKETLALLKTGLSTCLKLGQGYSLASGDAVKVAVFKGADTVLDAGSNAISAIAAHKDKSITVSNIELVEKVQQNHLARISAMKEIKEHITFLAELMHDIYGLNKQVVVLVDELDRCRPTYAIEMLEVIKHFFKTKGCVFLVATDTEALQHSIKVVYGNEFNAEVYLRRFFDRKIALSEISPLDYLNTKKLNFDKYLAQGILLYPFSDDQSYNIKVMAELFSHNQMELRDIEQALQKFFASLDYVALSKGEEKHIINSVVLITGIVENQCGMPCFVKRQTDISIPHQNENYGVINDKLSIVHLINSQLELVSKTNSYEVYTGNYSIEGDIKICLSIQKSNYLKKLSKYNLLNFNLANQITKQIEYYEKREHKYWLWDNYKGVIELSGYIE